MLSVAYNQILPVWSVFANYYNSHKQDVMYWSIFRRVCALRFCTLKNKSGVALTQLSLSLHYNKRAFYYQIYIHVKSFFLCFIVDELPAFIVIVYIF